MNKTDEVISLPLKSLLFGGGGLAIFIFGVACLYFGVSDGSLIFTVPMLCSPFISILGIIYGIKAIRENVSPKALAVVGIVISFSSLLIIIAITAIAMKVISGLEGIY